ncbi:hypothetical protein [Clostridium cochlearium]|uniref:hypothetical protein n=1 Tax=Clostridium cochlearium TaxID=1494 RepID=UPI000BBC405A|nr:hypothetical protein [Clostridium cochlearium]
MTKQEFLKECKKRIDGEIAYKDLKESDGDFYLDIIATETVSKTIYNFVYVKENDKFIQNNIILNNNLLQAIKEL